MKIAFIRPQFLYPRGAYIYVSQCVGIRSLSALLKSRNHEVVFVDALLHGISNVKPYESGIVVGLEFDEIFRQVPAVSDIVAIAAPFSFHAPLTHEIVARAKVAFPDKLIVIGGAYPSTQPRLALTSGADVVIVGEAEHALSLIADGSPLREIQGVYTQADAGRDSFPSAPVVADLDTLPFPDYSIPSMNEYFGHSPNMCGVPTGVVVTSRGCPYDCEYCSIHPVCGYKWRARSAKHVLEEITYAVKNFGIKCLAFDDDNFTLNKNRAAEILEGIIKLNENGAGLGWIIPNGLRIDTLDEDLISTMKRANLLRTSLALEHGDREMQKIMNKNLDLDKAHKVVSLFSKYNIPVHFFYIAGYPGETRQYFENGLKYLGQIQKTIKGQFSIEAFTAQPYPGTKLLARCRALGYINDPDYENFLINRRLVDSSVAQLETPDFSAEEVARRRNLILQAFDQPYKKWFRKHLPFLVMFYRMLKKVVMAILMVCSGVTTCLSTTAHMLMLP